MECGHTSQAMLHVPESVPVHMEKKAQPFTATTKLWVLFATGCRWRRMGNELAGDDGELG